MRQHGLCFLCIGRTGTIQQAQRRVTTGSQQGHRSKGTAGEYQVVQEWREKSSRRFSFRFSSFELKTTPHPMRSCFHNCLLCKHNLPTQAGELWRLLFWCWFFFCLFRLLFLVRFLVRALLEQNNIEKYYLFPLFHRLYYIIIYIIFPLLSHFDFYILLSPSPLYYLYFPLFLFLPPLSGLCYIVIYYIIPGGAFFSFPVYIDIILYISPP